MSKIKRNGTKPQVLSAREAVEYIADQDTVAVSGAGGGIVDPYALIMPCMSGMWKLAVRKI